MRLVRVGEPLSELVTLEDAKAHCRVDGDGDDRLVAGYIAAAIAYLDGPRGVLGRVVQRQQWRLDLHYGWDCDIVLPLPDAVDVTAISYDTEGAEIPVGVDLQQDGPMTRVRPLQPAAQPVRILFVADVPADILPALRQAVLLIVGHWYLHREEVGAGSFTRLPMSAQNLLAPLKMRWIA